VNHVSGESSLTCDWCGGPAIFRLETRAVDEYPAARIYTCERCGHVIWQKSQPVQQQQQPQPKNDEEDKK
jgi:hypothetical protein